MFRQSRSDFNSVSLEDIHAPGWYARRVSLAACARPVAGQENSTVESRLRAAIVAGSAAPQASKNCRSCLRCAVVVEGAVAVYDIEQGVCRLLAAVPAH